MNLSFSNINDKDIAVSKTEIIIHFDSSDECKHSVLAEEVVDQEPGHNLSFSDQVSNKNIDNNNNNIVFISDSVSKGISIKNLSSLTADVVSLVVQHQNFSTIMFVQL